MLYDLRQNNYNSKIGTAYPSGTPEFTFRFLIGYLFPV